MKRSTYYYKTGETLKFGKYFGLKLSEVAEIAPNYYSWLIRQKWFKFV